MDKKSLILLEDSIAYIKASGLNDKGKEKLVSSLSRVQNELFDEVFKDVNDRNYTRQELIDSVRDEINYRCPSRKALCEFGSSMICCAHCRKNNECLIVEDTKICRLVEVGEVSFREDCEGL